jgi:hypothetical protein
VESLDGRVEPPPELGDQGEDGRRLLGAVERDQDTAGGRIGWH